MGAGKTTVGRRLAERLQWPFVDTDECLVERFGPISDQFAQQGEEVFRARERSLIQELCDGKLRVLATGGGAWADEGARDALRRTYFCVTLVAPLPMLLDRIRDTDRPLRGVAEERYPQRMAAYRDADLVLDTANLTVEQVVEAIVCRR